MQTNMEIQYYLCRQTNKKFLAFHKILGKKLRQ